ncbi:MAG: hypothetical protein Fur0044_33150 [Anaerolineae bacterium]
MRVKKSTGWRLGFVATLLLSLGLVTACRSAETEAQPLPEIQTELLVRAPDGPLPVNKSIEVRSRTDASAGVSHVDLYVTLPDNQEVLVRSDAAAFQQKSFTASQTFTPKQVGHYIIKVVGYNLQGKSYSSNAIGFDVQVPPS